MLVPLTLEDVMVRSVETTNPDETAAAAARRLDEAAVSSLVVCENGHPAGIVTESHIVQLVARDAAIESVTVGEFMSGDLNTAPPEMSIEDAASLLAEHEFRQLPVVEDGALVGIVTTTDLARYLPHLSRGRNAWRERFVDRHDELPETAYDDPDWGFEHEGEPPLSVGDVVRFRKTLSDQDVHWFAEATGDTNRLHLDDEFAARTRFGGRIAHGVLTAGVISAALARIPGLTIYLSQDIRFLGPVRIGETITAVCEVVEELGDNKYELTTTVYDGDDEVVVDGEAVVLIEDLPSEDDARAADREDEPVTAHPE